MAFNPYKYKKSPLALKYKKKECKHSYWDYTYWGCKHPKCSLCGHEDITRILK